MKCQTCGGSGTIQAGNQVIACPICGGSGKDPFSGVWKVTEVGPIAVLALANGNGSSTAAAYDFDIYYLILTVINTATGAVIAAPSATALITDTSSKYQFSNQQAHVGNQFGTAQNPMALPVPYKLRKNVTLSIQVTDLSNVNTTHFYGLVGLQDLGS